MSASLHFFHVNQIPDMMLVWRCTLTDLERLKQFLGHTASLLDVIPNSSFLEVLVSTWDPEGAVFKIGECEMVPTLEEIAGLLAMPYIESKERFPTTNCIKTKPVAYPTGDGRIALCRIAGLKKTSIPGGSHADSVSLEFLFERYGTRDAYVKHQQDFGISEADWRSRRVLVFGVALAGVLLYPKKDYRITFSVVQMIDTLYQSRGSKTILPIILAQILISTHRCQRKEAKFFNGSNLILQIWALEHLLYKKGVSIGPCIDKDWIKRHCKWYKKPARVEDKQKWVKIFQGRTAEKVSWVLDWTGWVHPALSTTTTGCVPLRGLRDTTAYFPGRILRQLGRLQYFPQICDARLFIIVSPEHATSKLEEASNAWNQLRTDDMARAADCRFEQQVTSGYAQWARERSESVRSEQPELGPDDDLLERLLKEAVEGKDKALAIALDQFREATTLADEALRRYEVGKKYRVMCAEIYDDVKGAVGCFDYESNGSKVQRYEALLEEIERKLASVVGHPCSDPTNT